MTQKCSDLAAALKKKGQHQFIPADSIQSAIDHIEGVMGKCWTQAQGSRRIAHQMLDDEYIAVTRFYSFTTRDYVDPTQVVKLDGVFYDTDGTRLKPVKGYRPKTDAERHKRRLKAELAKKHDRRHRLVRTRRSRSRRMAEGRRSTPTAPISNSISAPVVEVGFSEYLSLTDIVELRIGELSPV